MAFLQGGYPGPFVQQDHRSNMHQYGPPQGNMAYQQHALYDLNGAALHSEHGYWQAPHAPRLSAAAARAGRLPNMVHGPFAYPINTPWQAQMGAGLYMQPQQPFHQPRTHQQLEHQLLMQHQMGKGNERSRPPLDPALHGSNLSYQGYSDDRRRSHSSRVLADETASYSNASHIRARSQTVRRSWEGQAPEHDVSSRESQRAPQDWRHASRWQQQQQAHRNSVPHLPHANQYQQFPGHRDSWPGHADATGQWHGQPSDQVHQYPVYHDAQGNIRPAVAYSAHRGHDAQHAQEHAELWAMHHAQQREYAYRASQEQLTALPGVSRRPSPDLWQPRPDTRRPELQQDAAAGKAKQGAETEPAVDQGPPPPSPDTLDNSAVPIAAVGAQLIWNACAALFDPELLVDAHDGEDENMDEDSDDHSSPTQASLPSSSSTPPINTPDISPWASTVLDRPAENDWNAFRSPFGPNAAAQTKGERGHNRVGSDVSFSNDLHRMAVGAERGGRSSHDVSPLHSRQTSTAQSDSAAANSSGASTASSSEPGTPCSVRDSSPALSSTISGRSSEARRSFRDSSIMSIDRSPTKSSIISPKSKAVNVMPTSKWSGRVRENVLAVLRLVSPDWKWSNNDHQLVSLVAPPAANAAVSPVRTQGRDSVTGIVTSYANEPSPAFRRFVHQVLAQTLLSPTAFLLGVLNALRMPLMARLPDGSIDPVVMDLFAQPTSAAPFKLLTLGLMISNKHLDDNTFLNKTWNEVTGIPLLELNAIEAWYLKKCNYEVTVPDDTWASFLHKLQSWQEKRSSCGAHRDQDCSKRLLIVLDEAVSHFDVIPNFRLDQSHASLPEAPVAASRYTMPSPNDGWGRPYQSRPIASRSTPAIGTVRSADDTCSTGASSDNASALLRSRSDYAASGSSKTLSPMSDGGSMSGPLMPSSLLNNSRSLLTTPI